MTTKQARACDWCWNWTRKRHPRGIIHMWGSLRVCRRCAIGRGGLIGRRKVAMFDIDQAGGFTPENLKLLASSGIMDANALFLPAGRLSMAETIERERAQLLPDA